MKDIIIPKEFIQFHFGMTTKYNGHVFTSKLQKNSIYMKNTGFFEQSDITEEINTRHYSKNVDYYISKNTFYASSRSIDALFSLENIVIDIDMHNINNIKEINRTCSLIIHKLINNNECNLIPNSIVETGRGLQLWYKILSQPYMKLNKFLLVTKDIINKINEILKCDNGLLFTIDKAASNNVAGLVRLPGTYNTQANKQTHLTMFHQLPIDIDEYARTYSLYSKKNKSKKNDSSQHNSTAIYDFRKKALEDLFELRGDATGYRNFYLFSLYCSGSRVIPDEKLMEDVYEFNKKFGEPLTEREIISYLTSARRKKYMVSNKKIIEWLNITEEEQRCIGFSLTEKKKKKTDEKKGKRITDKEKEEIKRLVKEGYNKTQIANELGFSNAAIGNCMKKMGISTDKEKLRNKVVKYLHQGFSIAEIAKKLKVERKKIAHIGDAFQRNKKEKERLTKEKIEKEEEKKKTEEKIKNEIISKMSKEEEYISLEIDNYFNNMSSFNLSYDFGFLPQTDEEKQSIINDLKNSCKSIMNGDYVPYKLYKKLKPIFTYHITVNARNRWIGEISEEFHVSTRKIKHMIRKYKLDPKIEEEKEWMRKIEELINEGASINSAIRHMSAYNCSGYKCRWLYNKVKNKLMNRKIKKENKTHKQRMMIQLA